MALRERITDQFSGRGTRADVWQALDLVLDTDAFLNLGYSAWHGTHALGDPQRRLATHVGRTVARHLPGTASGRPFPRAAGPRLLDVGCGRGGPAVHMADRFGFAVTGVDLVTHNVSLATSRAREHGVEAGFVVGDATQLPVAPERFRACTAVDALVYIPERRSVVRELADVLYPGGVAVVSDLVVRSGLSDADRRRVDAFAEAWDMPRPGTVESYREALTDAGLDVVGVEDLRPHSVGRFRRWSGPFLRLVDGPAGPLVRWALRKRGLDAAAVVEQIRLAHAALPALGHALVVGRKPRGR